MRFIPFALLSVAAIYFVSCGSGKEPEQAPSKFTLTDSMMSRIEIDTTTLSPLLDELKLTGKIIPDENNLVKIYPLVGGKVTFVNAELGDLVNTSKTLAIIQSGEAADFERQLVAAKTNFEVAKKNLSVEEEMFKSKFSSEKEVLNARKEFEQADADLKRIEEVMRVYKISNKGDYIVTSPIAGFIIEKKIGPDVQLRSDMADHMFSVARLDSVFVTMNIYESDIHKVKKGMDAKISVFSYPDSVIHGKVDRVLNFLDPDSKTIQARVKLYNPGYLLKPDMNCAITLSFKENRDMLCVPSSALVFDKSKKFVMVYKNRDEIETREVEVYREINGTAFIAGGLEAGDKVISKNQLFIYDALND